MGNIVYLSENKIFTSDLVSDSALNSYSGNSRELVSQRAVQYKKTIQNINQRKEWKNSGSGAMFMGAYNDVEMAYEASAYISGISKYENDFLYSINLDGVGGMYRKTITDDLSEGHITANEHLQIRDIDILGNRCVASVGNSQTRNLAVFTLPSGSFVELTEGDTREDFPSFSKHDENRILFSSAGLARDTAVPLAGPYAAMVYDSVKGEMEELFAHNELDFIRVKEDTKGNIYLIKRPYNTQTQGNIIADIFLLPWRMIKAIFRFL